MIYMYICNIHLYVIRAPIPQVRSKEQIESSGAYERDQYAPKPLTRFGKININLK